MGLQLTLRIAYDDIMIFNLLLLIDVTVLLMDAKHVHQSTIAPSRFDKNVCPHQQYCDVDHEK